MLPFAVPCGAALLPFDAVLAKKLGFGSKNVGRSFLDPPSGLPEASSTRCGRAPGARRARSTRQGGSKTHGPPTHHAAPERLYYDKLFLHTHTHSKGSVEGASPRFTTPLPPSLVIFCARSDPRHPSVEATGATGAEAAAAVADGSE